MTIQDLLKGLGVEWVEHGQHHHTRHGWLQLDCPYCGRDTKGFHLGYNLSRGYFNCWRCGALHRWGVLSRLGARPDVIKEFLGNREFSVGDPQKQRSGLKEPSGRTGLLPAHEAYLRGRGFNPNRLVQLWQLEGIALHQRLSWRVYIPITLRGVRVSWTTRAIGDKVTQRYVSASAEEEAVNHKEVVYGLDHVSSSVVVVEGPADAWNVGPGAGALFGLSFSTAQVRRLVQVPYRYVVFDNSPDAQGRAEELCQQLAVFPGHTERIELDAEDPGSATPKEIKRLRRACRLSS